jgi:hypothetical protein
LAAYILDEGSHSLLHDLDNVVLECRKVVLNTDEVLTIVVLLDNLLMEAVHDAALSDVWIIVSMNLMASSF